MKKWKLSILLFIGVINLAGCSKTEKDTSFNTELIGTFQESMVADNTDYEERVEYTFNSDNTYTVQFYQRIDGQVLQDGTRDDSIESIELINSDITKIVLNNGESQLIRYKYKNMLGTFDIANIPNKKTFNLFIQDLDYPDDNSGFVFTEDGHVHHCSDSSNCTDDKDSFIKYKHKGNHIYQEDSLGNWTILFYIVDDGIFMKQYTKEQ